jgi:hypothetical protein
MLVVYGLLYLFCKLIKGLLTELYMALDQGEFLALVFTGVTVGAVMTCAVVKFVCHSIGRRVLGKLTYTKEEQIEHAKLCASSMVSKVSMVSKASMVSIKIEDPPLYENDNKT